MTDADIKDWDDAYANGAHVPGSAAYPDIWASAAETFRAGWADTSLDVAYGTSDRQKLDLFHPQGISRGLVIFVHGGYWLRFDKSFWSHFAAGALQCGWTVALPSYDLAPAVSIGDITQQIGSAITFAAERQGGPVRLAGHSAGGHLVTRMVCDNSPLDAKTLSRLENVVSISGLHDLRPLRKTLMNDSFCLSEAAAAEESPALRTRKASCAVTAWVGAAERPEFVRQSRLLSEAWPGTRLHVEPDRHHFDVIDALKDPESQLVRTLLST
nr:alpha/beta hydrolase [uncultured Roseibium sp.]